MKLKTARILFWVLYILLSLTLLPSTLPSVVSLDYAVAHFHGHLGYPEYFLPFTSVAKILGLIAIIIPGYPRIKEWAYAGLVFDLVGAIFSGIAVGDGISVWIYPLVDLVLVIACYVVYHKIVVLRNYERSIKVSN